MRVLTFPRDEFHNPRDNSQTVSSRIIITVETARVCFNIQQLHGSSKNVNSIKSTIQSQNITRDDPRVTHELYIIKLNSRKPQQPGTFVIEHQKEKSANLQRKFKLSPAKQKREYFNSV